jgi:hypothetical protein
MAIDVGPGYEDLASQDMFAGYTGIDKDNPANASGTLTTMYFRDIGGQVGLVMGTFSGSDTTYTARDYVSLGNAVNGLNTFTGVQCDVETGDFLAMYSDAGSGYHEMDNKTGTVYYRDGDNFSGTTTGWTLYSNHRFSMYATGTETAAGGQPLKNVFGRPFRGCFR